MSWILWGRGLRQIWECLRTTKTFHILPSQNYFPSNKLDGVHFSAQMERSEGRTVKWADSKKPKSKGPGTMTITKMFQQKYIWTLKKKAQQPGPLAMEPSAMGPSAMGPSAIGPLAMGQVISQTSAPESITVFQNNTQADLSDTLVQFHITAINQVME